WATRPDHVQLRPGVTFAFIRSQRLGHGQCQRCGLAQTLCPAKTGLYGTFVLVDGVKTRHDIAQHKPSYKADDNTDGNAYHSMSFGVAVVPGQATAGTYSQPPLLAGSSWRNSIRSWAFLSPPVSLVSLWADCARMTEPRDATC